MFWHPPSASFVTSNLGRRLGVHAGHFWTKTGPDAISLPESHQLQILSASGQLRHIRILDEDGKICVEMSGHVVLNPDWSSARYHHVEVEDDQMKAFGTFSTNSVLLAGCLQLLGFATRLALSMHFEAASEIEIIWWRILSSLLSIVGAQYALVDIIGVAFAGQHVSAFVQLVGTFAVLIATTPLYLVGASQFFAELASACSCLFITAILQYWRTRNSHPKRQFGPSVAWVVAYSLCTYGFVGVVLLNGMAYISLLAHGYVIGSSLFLPSATAACELVFIAVVREVYCRCAWPHRTGGTGGVPGDQLYIPVTFAVASTHASSECVRLAAVLAGAILGGTLPARLINFPEGQAISILSTTESP